MGMKGSKYLQIAAYIMLSLIFVIVISIARNCSRVQFTPLEGNSGGDTIDLAILYGPGSYYLYDDTLSGINHALALKFSNETSTPIKIWPVNEPGNALEKLKSGIFDCVASLPLDNSLKKNYSVSESVFLDRLVLVQLTDSVTGKKIVESTLDLNEKTVSVAAGSTGVQRLRNLSDEIGGKIEILENPDLSDELICLQVASGKIPLAVVNERIARKIALTYPTLNYDNSVSFTQFQVWVFNPTDTLLLSNFNNWFVGFQSTQEYREILEKY